MTTARVASGFARVGTDVGDTSFFVRRGHVSMNALYAEAACCCDAQRRCDDLDELLDFVRAPVSVYLRFRRITAALQL
jgi:hypothetical protein